MQQRIIIVVILCLNLVGCFFYQRDRLPFELGQGILPLKECGQSLPQKPKSFTRLYRVKTEYGGKRTSLRMLVQYRAPERLRIELMPAVGSFYVLSRIELNGLYGEFVDYGAKIHIQKKSTELLEEILGVGLSVEAAASVLSGGGPFTNKQLSELRCTQDRKFITLADASVYGTNRTEPQHYFIRSGDRLKFAVLTYRSKKTRKVNKIELSQMPNGIQVTVLPSGSK